MSENPYQLDPNLVSFYFLEHENEEKMLRNISTLFELLSDLGGFLEIVFFITAILVYQV